MLTAELECEHIEFPTVQMPRLGHMGNYVASRVVRYARYVRNIHEDKMWCVECRQLPENPVTGRCGHTRCNMCIKRHGPCYCGVPAPEILHSNILVRNIIEKMLHTHSFIRSAEPSSCMALNAHKYDLSLISYNSSGRINKSVRQSRRQFRIYAKSKKVSSLRRMMGHPLFRGSFAQEMINSERYHEAGAHYAFIAACAAETNCMARILVRQVANVLNLTHDPRIVIRTLYRSISQQSNTAFIDPSSMDCPVCFNVLVHPVTTTCGHTFCRNCIRRTMQTRVMCPLCSSSLTDFCLAQTGDTDFVNAILSAVANQPQRDTDLIPIFVCTVAYPNIPCPLMIFDFDFRNVVRGVLDSGSQRFGMLAAMGDNGQHANYGTIIEVRDCVVFEDGKSILTTVGITRFKVLEKMTINGCPYARVQEHIDTLPITEVQICDLQLLADQICVRVNEWLPSLEIALRTAMSNCFGTFPDLRAEGEWWRNPRGPIWLWWLIAVLPLRTEIQLLMLTTKHLVKRMTAVLRTLDAMEYYTYLYRMM